MYISLDWISDYVDLTGLDSADIADKLTLSTAEVEGVETITRFVDGVIIGKIVAAEPVSGTDGKKLTFCTVDCGGKQYTTVCGAPNAKVGLVAPFAPIGTVLAGNKKVEKTEMFGKPSEGILCSAAELGMSDWHEIVFECPSETKIGAPFTDYVPKTDTLIEIDNKSLTHRADLWGHYGFARELAAVFGRKLKPLSQNDLSVYDNLPAYSLAVDDLENCPAYGCVEMQFAEKATVPSPIFMQRRLHALGQRTYNLLIDVTNYVSQELGQPTHAFDGDLVAGIKVKQAEQNTKFKTLDGQTRSIIPEDLMICGVLDKNGKVDLEAAVPVAIAGIMGGAETEVSDATTKVLLESANFRAARIRKTSTRLDLRTDASQRYEKSQPPCNVKTGAQRIVQLIIDAGLKPTITSRFTLQGSLANETRTIIIEPGKLQRLAGIDLPQEKIVSILSSLEFEPKFEKDGTLTVGIPPFRSAKDISIPEDIVEETLRIYGYDNIPPIMPVSPIRELFVEDYIRVEHKARKLLAVSHKFIEVHNYGWINDQWAAKIGYDPSEPFVLKNPAAQGEARLRTTLVANLLNLVPKNRSIRDRFRLFELGHVYLPNENAHKKGTTETGCDEVARLSGVSFQQSGTTLEEHYLSIKSAIEDLAQVFNGPEFRFVAEENSDALVPWKNAGHYAGIYQNEKYVGALGVIDKKLLEKIWPEGGQIVWFELDLDKINTSVYPAISCVNLPKFPGSWQDFSLVWSIDAGFAELEKVLDSFKHPLINRREFVVVYKGKGMEKGTASYSFRYWIGADDHTLSGEEIDGFHKTYLEFLKEKNIQLRG